MNKAIKSSLNSYLKSVNSEELINILELLNGWVKQDLVSEAAINRLQKRVKNNHNYYVEVATISDETFDDLDYLIKAKAKNINDPVWLKFYSFQLLDLLKKSQDSRLNSIFEGRLLVDSFGFLLNEGSLDTYRNLDDEILARIKVFSMPNIPHVADRIRAGLKSKWDAYKFAENIKLDLPSTNKKNAVIFVIDPKGEVDLIHNKPIKYKFSHTKHILQHIQAFIDRGYAAILLQKEAKSLIEVTNVIGDLQIKERFLPDRLDDCYHLVGYCSIYLTDFLDSRYTRRKNITNILIQPAVHWVENARLFPPDYLTCVQAVAPLVDIVVTQNPRMIELTRALLELGGNRAPDENFLTVPLGVWSGTDKVKSREKIRKKYGYDRNVKAIVNGGGAWDWTATDMFLEQFLNYCLHKPDTKLRFVQMGLRQTTNIDHNNTVKKINKILNKYSSIASKYVVIESWNKASEMLPEALYGFDYGFSVSKFTVEAFQAHRVRLTEYLQHGIPPIINAFDSLQDVLGSCCYKIDESLNFTGLFEQLEDEENDVYEKKRMAIGKAILLINKLANSQKIVDALERNDPGFKFDNLQKVENTTVNMLKKLTTAGWYDSNNLILQSKNNHTFKRDVLKTLNRLSKLILPKFFYERLYRIAFNITYGKNI